MKIYYKGAIYNESFPKISIINRGIFYGETVFTTVRVEKDFLLFFDDHLERLKECVFYLLPETVRESFNWINFSQDISRGVDLLVRQKAFDAGKIRITCFLEGEDISTVPTKGRMEFFILMEEIDFSYSKDVSLNLVGKKLNVVYGNTLTKIKSGNYFSAFRSKGEVIHQGFDDVIFLTYNSEVLESTTSNIFFKKGNTVFTPKVCEYVLEGITRKHLIDCLKINKIDVQEGIFNIEELYQADCAWLTSSLKGIQTIFSIDSKIIGDNNSDEITPLIQLFKDYIERFV